MHINFFSTIHARHTHQPANEQLKRELVNFLQEWTNELHSSIKLSRPTTDSDEIDSQDLNTEYSDSTNVHLVAPGIIITQNCFILGTSDTR